MNRLLAGRKCQMSSRMRFELLTRVSGPCMVAYGDANEERSMDKAKTFTGRPLLVDWSRFGPICSASNDAMKPNAARSIRSAPGCMLMGSSISRQCCEARAHGSEGVDELLRTGNPPEQFFDQRKR